MFWFASQRIRETIRAYDRRRLTHYGASSLQLSGGNPRRAPRSLRILMADDDRDTVHTLMIVLRHEGHEARGVYKGLDMMRTVWTFSPDAVIVDINMPDLSGHGVARAINETWKGRSGRPLLIGTSGVYREDSDKILARQIGFDHYLTKPYQSSDVLSLLAPLRLPSED